MIGVVLVHPALLHVISTGALSATITRAKLACLAAKLTLAASLTSTPRLSLILELSAADESGLSGIGADKSPGLHSACPHAAGHTHASISHATHPGCSHTAPPHAGRSHTAHSRSTAHTGSTTAGACASHSRCRTH